jgi:hypothetical protein
MKNIIALLMVITAFAAKAGNDGEQFAIPFQNQEAVAKAALTSDELAPVITAYINLKDALVASNSNDAAAKANLLLTAINAVDMNKLTAKQHDVWMKVMATLKKNTSSIAVTKKLDDQRTAFSKLSDHMYNLAKTAAVSQTIYYQKCPMANKGKGATWLSLDKGIKNPYYGNQMLTCGSNLEAIEK